MLFRHRLLITCLPACLMFAAQPLDAQPRSTPNPAAVRQLDMEADRLQQDFVDSLIQLADGYEEAGDVAKARAALRRILELDPDRKEIESRLDEMRNRVFNNNEVQLEVDVARGWVSTGIKVQEGKAVRIAAEGSYKLILNATLTADGVADKDINRDMTSGVKLGALTGVVFPPPKGRAKPQPGRPFFLGSASEFSPEQSGMLFLRLNIPAGTKSVGKVKVTISGNFER